MGGEGWSGTVEVKGDAPGEVEVEGAVEAGGGCSGRRRMTAQNGYSQYRRSRAASVALRVGDCTT